MYNILMKKTLTYIYFSFLILIISPISVFGQTSLGGGSNANPSSTGGGSNTSAPSITLDNPLGNNVQDIPTLVEKILDIALTIGVPIIALAIIYSGYLFIAAQGNKDKLQEAKQTLLYVFIGAAILLASYAIANAIVDTIAAIRG